MRSGIYLGLGSLLVEGEGSINFGRDTSGNDSEDLLSEFDELKERKQSEIV
jgi:hypothetical protein